MFKSVFWWIVETFIWYCFIFLILFSAKNNVDIVGMSFLIVVVGSLGIFASPLTRHLSIWNKVLDKIIKREEEDQKY